MSSSLLHPKLVVNGWSGSGTQEGSQGLDADWHWHLPLIPEKFWNFAGSKIIWISGPRCRRSNVKDEELTLLINTLVMSVLFFWVKQKEWRRKTSQLKTGHFKYTFYAWHDSLCRIFITPENFTLPIKLNQGKMHWELSLKHQCCDLFLWSVCRGGWAE